MVFRYRRRYIECYLSHRFVFHLDTECSPKGVYESSLLLTIDLQTTNIDVSWLPAKLT